MDCELAKKLCTFSSWSHGVAVEKNFGISHQLRDVVI
jgi:hypothetical protein